MGFDKDREKDNDRRAKHRFAIKRELRFKVLDGVRPTTTGVGNTVDISSGGVAFETVPGCPRIQPISLLIPRRAAGR